MRTETVAFRADETILRTTADTLVSSGLAAAGYTFLNVDDCWQNATRDANGAACNVPRFSVRWLLVLTSLSVLALQATFRPTL
jgi:hypothetical protein